MGKKMGKKKLKLHIGCGSIYKKGFVNIDAYNLSKIDLKAKASKLPYKDNCVDMIENHHLLEHLDRFECDLTLKEWYRVLKPKGRLKIEVPDLAKNMEIFLSSSYHQRWENYRLEFKYGRIQTIYGLGEEEGQLHKNGFDKKRLKKLLQTYGFINIKVFSKKGTPIKKENILAVCEKPKNQITLKKYKINKDLFVKTKSLTKYKESNSLFRKFFKKIKKSSVFTLRYLADTVEELKFPKF